jgi:hypothetical protein
MSLARLSMALTSVLCDDGESRGPEHMREPPLLGCAREGAPPPSADRTRHFTHLCAPGRTAAADPTACRQTERPSSWRMSSNVRQRPVSAHASRQRRDLRERLERRFPGTYAARAAAKVSVWAHRCAITTARIGLAAAPALRPAASPANGLSVATMPTDQPAY